MHFTSDYISFNFFKMLNADHMPSTQLSQWNSKEADNSLPSERLQSDQEKSHSGELENCTS